MKPYSQIKVWNFDAPPYPREGIFPLNMSENCQVTRLLKFEAGQLARKNQLDVISNAAELRRFQTKLRRKIREKMYVPYDPSLDLDVTELGTIRRDGFSITKIMFQSRPDFYVTALLYVPDGKGPFPAVLQMHGHDHLGKFSSVQQEFATELVKKGFVCLSIDAIGTYERASQYCHQIYHGSVLGAAMFNLGETLMGAQVADNMRAVDLLQSLDYVLKDKIGAVGASGGGNQTMWVSAMDERIAAAMPVVSVGSFESYVYGSNCICELLPDGLTITEESGILALIAPRPLRIGNALYDCNHDFSVAEMLKTYHPVERVYWAVGKPQNISFNVADRVHGMRDRQQESALGFFMMYLKGEGSGNPLPLSGAAEHLPIEELKLFPEGRPEKVRTLHRHYKLTGENLRKEFLARKTISVPDAKAELRKMLRISTVLPALKLYRYAAVDGTGRAALEAGVHLIPFLIRPGKAEGKYRILLHTEGKDCLDEKTLAEAAADGATLILPDLFGTGETAQASHLTGLHHQFFRQMLWIGRSLIGEWVFDILALAKVLKTQFKAKDIDVTGLRETGAAAIFANAFSDCISSVTPVDSPVSFLFDDTTNKFEFKDSFAKFLPNAIYSLVMSIPGFLKWGDISLAAALGSGKVDFVSPRTFDGTPCTKEQYKAWKNEVAKVRKKLIP